MAFEGGPLDVVGLTPTSFSEKLSDVTAAGAKQSFKNVGGQAFGRTGQYLLGSAAKATVNVALNSQVGKQVSGPGGASLSSGVNFLASTLTPYVSSSIAQSINTSLQKTLQSAGPFGNLLAPVANNLVSSFLPSLGGGSGSTGSANYGGKAFTLKEVTFSLRPANSGPQTSGLTSNYSFPKNTTSVPFNQATKMSLVSPNDSANIMKAASMGGNTYQSAWSTTSPSFSKSANIPLSFF